jgi:hypothetical protein
MLITKDETDRIFRDIFARSQRDPEFRQLCLTDAAAAVTEISGQSVPPGFALRFVDNAGAHLTLVLPDPVGAEGELSDEELSGVSGGLGSGASMIQLQNFRFKKG